VLAVLRLGQVAQRQCNDNADDHDAANHDGQARRPLLGAGLHQPHIKDAQHCVQRQGRTFGAVWFFYTHKLGVLMFGEGDRGVRQLGAQGVCDCWRCFEQRLAGCRLVSANFLFLLPVYTANHSHNSGRICQVSVCGRGGNTAGDVCPIAA
jgi:hypothetical protein